MEYLCVICGSPVDLGRWALGCKVFCDDCYNNQEVMDWYRTKEATHVKTA